MIHNALNTDQMFTGNAIVSHQFLRMDIAEVAFLQHFLLLHSIVESNKVLGKLLGFERFGQGGSADWTESQFLNFNLEQTLFTESVATVEVSRDSGDCIEELVA
jgi:hypothetical protein